jgi:hypothetical protein
MGSYESVLIRATSRGKPRLILRNSLLSFLQGGMGGFHNLRKKPSSLFMLLGWS